MCRGVFAMFRSERHSKQLADQALLIARMKLAHETLRDELEATKKRLHESEALNRWYDDVFADMPTSSAKLDKG